MIETENYMYKRDEKIEQFIEIFVKNRDELKEMKVLLKAVYDNFEEIINEKNELVKKFESMLNNSKRDGFEAKFSRLEKETYSDYIEEKNKVLNEKEK